jgi:spermidine synthase
MFLSNWTGESEPPNVISPATSKAQDNLAIKATVKPLLVIAAASGFAALVYEIAWFRLMALILGASTYAFSVMLLAFLIGIGAGGWLAGPIADLFYRKWKQNGVFWGLAGIQIFIGLSTFAMMWLYRDLPYLFVQLFDETAAASGLTWGRQIWLAILIMTPPALLMGATFPFMVRAATGPKASALGRSVGRIYGANTLGSLIGAVAAGFFLLPLLNVVGAVRVAVAVNIVGALVAVFSITAAAKTRNRLIGTAVAVATWVGITMTPPPWDPLLMTSGMYKYVSDLSGSTQQNIDRFAVADFELLYYDEGYSSVVTVAQSRRSGNIWLANNGKVDASSTLDMPTQVLVAHLPFLFHDEPKIAAVIGLASGSTVGAATLHHSLEQIEAIELEPAIVQASHFFDDFNHRPLEDERVELFLNDGRNHLLRADEGRYDIIISEPSNPWITGVSNLFTREFFEMGRSRLAPGGVWSQWVQVYGMHPDDLRSILATFSSVFPYTTLFATIEDSDLVLIGSESPLVLDIENVRTMLQDPEMADEMEIIDVNNEYDLLAYYRLDQDGLTDFIDGAVLNTDDNMRIEYSAPKHLHDATISDNLSALMRGHHVPNVENHEDLLNLARAYGNHDDWLRGMIALQRIREEDPENIQAELLHRQYRRQFEQSHN